MLRLVKKSFIYFLICTTVVLTLPRKAPGLTELPNGKETADEAAAPDLDEQGSHSLTGWSATSAWADTTGYEFPEEESKRNVALEVALYVIVAGFIAFFIIEVFLQGDTDDPPPPNGGKPPPGVAPPR
jgi:hypothetical protein